MQKKREPKRITKEEKVSMCKRTYSEEGASCAGAFFSWSRCVLRTCKGEYERSLSLLSHIRYVFHLGSSAVLFCSSLYVSHPLHWLSLHLSFGTCLFFLLLLFLFLLLWLSPWQWVPHWRQTQSHLSVGSSSASAAQTRCRTHLA